MSYITNKSNFQSNKISLFTNKCLMFVEKPREIYFKIWLRSAYSLGEKLICRKLNIIKKILVYVFSMPERFLVASRSRRLYILLCSSFLRVFTKVSAFSVSLCPKCLSVHTCPGILCLSVHTCVFVTQCFVSFVWTSTYLHRRNMFQTKIGTNVISDEI